MKKVYKSVFAPLPHIFLFKTAQGGVLKIPVRVRYATEPVDIYVTEEDALRGINLNGQGDTQNCPGALCVVRERNKFPHKIADIGIVDWYPSRMWTISKARKKTNQPLECVEYEHDGGIDDIVDSTPDGLFRLLEKIRATPDKRIKVSLKPSRDHGHGSQGKTKIKGKFKNRRAILSRGHEHRYAKAMAGALTLKAMEKASKDKVGE